MPGQPLICSKWDRTKETAFRVGWRGTLVLQVKEIQKIGHATGNGPQWNSERVRWSDARLDDFVQLPQIAIP
jgi:hypothetical protein